MMGPLPLAEPSVLEGDTRIYLRLRLEGARIEDWGPRITHGRVSRAYAARLRDELSALLKPPALVEPGPVPGSMF